MDFKLLCPKCGKEPSRGNLFFLLPRSTRHMYIPFFMCSDCQIIHADKGKLKQYIRRWKKLDFIKRYLPSNKVLYTMALEKVENTIDYYVAKIGFNRGRFVRKPTGPTK